MNLNERKLQILQAIVSEFINTAEPVGSRYLSKSCNMGISPATIRNEMADLEDMGYLTHPHTSAGRVPSDKGYRLYVDELMDTGELPEEKKLAIQSRLNQARMELDDTIEHAANLLSEITQLTSFAVAPGNLKSRLKYLHFLPVDSNTVVLMIVAEDGQVVNKAIRLSVPYKEKDLELMSKIMTRNYMGKKVTALMAMNIVEDFTKDMHSLSALARDVAPSFMKTLEKMLDAELYMYGYTNLFKLPEFSADIERAVSFLRVLEDKDYLTDVLVNRDSGVIITIGDENAEAIKDCSLITADYCVNGRYVGKLGVIGPTRMKYGQVTSVIKYICDHLSETFQIEEEDYGKD